MPHAAVATARGGYAVHNYNNQRPRSVSRAVMKNDMANASVRAILRANQLQDRTPSARHPEAQCATPFTWTGESSSITLSSSTLSFVWSADSATDALSSSSS